MAAGRSSSRRQYRQLWAGPPTRAAVPACEPRARHAADRRRAGDREAVARPSPPAARQPDEARFRGAAPAPSLAEGATLKPAGGAARWESAASGPFRPLAAARLAAEG